MTSHSTPPDQAPAAEPGTAKREKRWWMWILAVITLLSTLELRYLLGSPFRWPVLVLAVLSLAGLIFVCSRWRGKIVPGFLAMGGALCVLEAVHALLP